MRKYSVRRICLLGLASLTGALLVKPALAQNVSFLARRDFSVGAIPQGVAVGDFDGDGIPDLAVATTTPNAVAILLGNGDGTFKRPVSFPINTPPNFLVVGDFNRDGFLDVVVGSSSGLRVLLGNGDGTFRAAINVFLQNRVAWIAAGDFDQNGTLDLIVVGKDFHNAGVAVLLLGKGDGTFQVPRIGASAVNPTSVVASDFNRDGALDVAFSDAGTNSLVLLLGLGDGTFETPRTYDTGRTPRAITAADFNRDGFLDLAVANFDSDEISLLRGNGDGTFRARQW